MPLVGPITHACLGGGDGQVREQVERARCASASPPPGCRVPNLETANWIQLGSCLQFL